MSTFTIPVIGESNTLQGIATILNGKPFGRRITVKRLPSETTTRSGIMLKVNEELASKIIVEIVQVGADCTTLTEADVGRKCVVFSVGAEWYDEFEDGKLYGEIGETEVLRLLNR
jgi:co-chaperonin GroES (HSP10)